MAIHVNLYAINLVGHCLLCLSNLTKQADAAFLLKAVGKHVFFLLKAIINCKHIHSQASTEVIGDLLNYPTSFFQKGYRWLQEHNGYHSVMPNSSSYGSVNLLKNRNQRAGVNGQLLQWRDVKNGVPLKICISFQHVHQ